ncbi:MAG: HEAT repeat domain-containing protein [Cyanobacteria bacterium P01_H01_bin.153]
MVVELLTPMAGWALGKAADTAWTVGTDQVQTKLQRTDIERAIKAGLEAVREWEQSLEVAELLFKSCDDRQKRQFLAQVFVDAGVVEQLQRSLTGKGEPDVELMQPYFDQVAKDTGVELTQSSLQQWLSIFARTYFAKTTLFIKYELARQRYLEQLANWYDDVKFLGISVAGQEDTKSEKLLQIFVMPDVKGRPELQTTQKDFFLRVSGNSMLPADSGKDTLASGSGSTELLLVLDDYEKIASDPLSGTSEFWREVNPSIRNTYRRTSLMQEQLHLASLLKQKGKTFSATELLKQSKFHRCVLLGAPGSGKTTLMSYFAVALATKENVEGLGVDDSYLPIVVRIRDWVQSDQTSLLDYIRAFATDKLAVKALPEGFFEHWLEAGKALILLDGLDEVANEARRDDVVNQIEVFLQGQLYRDNPAIITSRPAGYKQAYFRTEEFPHYDLLPFDQPKIDAFIQNWYDNRFQDQAESQRRQQTLKKALSERDRIQMLAKNPLLLTIIALIHRYEAYLPRDRHQLYNRAVETLLTNWDAGKDIDYTWPLQYLKRDAVRRVMEQLAYWIHSEGSVGDDEGGTLIDREELIEQLSRFIAEEVSCKRYEAKADAERFLEFIRSRTGLLNEQGQDRYAFVHKTFQEYLAAEDIKYRADEEYDEEIILQPIREHLHNPHWEEVLLLLIAQQPKKRVAQIMQQILDHDTPYEHWLHRNLFFAADCLAENVKLADVSLVDQILNQLVEFTASDSPLISSQLQQRVEKCLMNLGETNFQNTALQQLETRQELLDTILLQRFRFALGQEFAATTNLITSLSDANSRVREDAAFALGQLGQGNPSIFQALVDCFSDSSSDVRYRAARALGQIGRGDPNIVQTLIKCLSDENSSVRYQSATVLGELKSSDPNIVQPLIECLSDENSSVRYQSAVVLGQLDRGNQSSIQTLIECLSDDNSSIRENAAGALGELKNSDSTILQALIKCLKDNNSRVRENAVRALGKLRNSDPTILQALIKCLKDSEGTLRYLAADSLGRLGQSSPVVVQALFDHLSDNDSIIRFRAADALRQLGQSDPSIVQAFIARLSDDDFRIRFQAAVALGKLRQGSPVVVQALTNYLSDDDASVRYLAADSLRQLGQGDPSVIQALIDRLSDDDLRICYLAADTLKQLGKQTDTITAQLAEWIEQNQQSDNVVFVIDALWAIVTEQV